jgi:hypothetical protein
MATVAGKTLMTSCDAAPAVTTKVEIAEVSGVLLVVTVYVPALVNTSELRDKLATPLAAVPVTTWE